MASAQLMSLMQMKMMDQQQAMTIQTQIMADAKKQQMQRFKIMYDTQTKIFEIMQDTTFHKAKTADKAFNMADAYIRQ